MAKSKLNTILKDQRETLIYLAENCETYAEIYRSLEISKDSFYKYMRESADFSDIIKNAQDKLIRKNVDNLKKSAQGNTITETIEEVKTDKNGKIISKHIKKTTKQLAPDVTAQIYLDKTRNAHGIEYKEKQARIDLNTSKTELNKALVPKKNGSTGILKEIAEYLSGDDDE